MCVPDADVPTTPPRSHRGTRTHARGRESPKITAWDLTTSAISPSPPPPSCFSSRPPVAAPASHPPRHLDVPNARATAVAPRPPRRGANRQWYARRQTDEVRRRRHHHQGQNGGNANAMHKPDINSDPSIVFRALSPDEVKHRAEEMLHVQMPEDHKSDADIDMARHRLHRPSRALGGTLCRPRAARTSRGLGCPRRFPSKRRPSRPSARGATPFLAQQLVRQDAGVFAADGVLVARHAMPYATVVASQELASGRSSSMACGHLPSSGGTDGPGAAESYDWLYTCRRYTASGASPRRVRSYSDLVAPYRNRHTACTRRLVRRIGGHPRASTPRRPGGRGGRGGRGGAAGAADVVTWRTRWARRARWRADAVVQALGNVVGFAQAELLGKPTGGGAG